MSPKMLRNIIIFVSLGVLLYIGVYLWGSHSESFKFVEQSVKNSQTLQSQIGKIQDVRLTLFGSYSEKFVDSDETVRMTVKVTGAIKTVNLNVKVTKIRNVWRIEQVLIDEKPILLD